MGQLLPGHQCNLCAILDQLTWKMSSHHTRDTNHTGFSCTCTDQQQRAGTKDSTIFQRGFRHMQGPAGKGASGGSTELGPAADRSSVLQSFQTHAPGDPCWS